MVFTAHLVQAFNRFLKIVKAFVEMAPSKYIKQIKVGLVWRQLGVRARAPLSVPPSQKALEAIPGNPGLPRNTLRKPLISSLLAPPLGADGEKEA